MNSLFKRLWEGELDPSLSQMSHQLKDVKMRHGNSHEEVSLEKTTKFTPRTCILDFG